MSLQVSQFKALGRDRLPQNLRIEGKTYRLEKTFKHKFATAVGMYRRHEDLVICKFHRRTSFLGLPTDWLGAWMAAYEEENLRRCQGLEGVPEVRGTRCAGVVAHEFIPGHPLHDDTPVKDSFFPRLLRLLEDIHARDMAYVDLEKRDNVLVGTNGQPYLIDFQLAVHLPRMLQNLMPPARWFLNRLQHSDRYHAMKHFRRVRPDLMSEEEKHMASRKPGAVQLSNVLTFPIRSLKRLFLKRHGRR